MKEGKFKAETIQDLIMGLVKSESKADKDLTSERAFDALIKTFSNDQMYSPINHIFMTGKYDKL